MSHEHCDKCFLINCLHSSSCPLIYCSNGCSARMHECKQNDHEYICPNVFIPCLNVGNGCPSTVRRCHLSRHLRVCPASITVCSFMYMHQYYINTLENPIDTENETNIIQQIARRDNIWYEHITEFESKEKQLFTEKNDRKNKINQLELIIRSEKYRYITMPECVLSRGNGVICSTCRQHLRQLEENEDQRLSQLSEDERQMMLNFNLHYEHSSEHNDPLTTPSLVKMSSTLINFTDIPTVSPSSHLTTDVSPIDPMPVISDIDLPSSYIYRLNYLSSNKYLNNLSSFNKNPKFYCHALCRRDEIEQHWYIHYHIDCILNTSLIQQCPKSAYGCSFQYESLEPCQTDGQPIRIRFDQNNDAIAFEWKPSILEECNQHIGLLDLPSETLDNILLKLDSLSLRNISLVCRRLRALCQGLLPSRGTVSIEYERKPGPHGEITWTEKRKHWLFTNTSSAVPKWQLKAPNKLTSLNQHLITCPYGEKKDLQNEPPFRLISFGDSKFLSKPTE